MEKTEEVSKMECAVEEKKIDNHLTLSTKLSTDHLICKTPQGSPNASVRSLQRDFQQKKLLVIRKKFFSLLGLGVLQMIFGFLMVGFGVFVIFEEASLSQIGGGIWAGCLAVATGAAGILAGAKDWCPLKSTPQRVAHTTFLALSLVSLAVAHLVLVLAATGLARDLHKAKDGEDDGLDHPTTTTPQPNQLLDLPSNYLAIIANICLLLVAAVECVVAAISSYRSARSLCACFRSPGEELYCDYPVDHRRDALVSSWLGKQNMAQQFYVVAAPTSSLGKKSKLSSMTPVYAIPPPPPPIIPPPIMSYPLIPAPLGPVPSPIIHHHPYEYVHRRHKPHPAPPIPRPVRDSPKRKRSKSKEKPITTEDVARTYTGLDRTIAEEFIEMCDSQNTSLCSDSSCQSSSNSSMCRCQHPCEGCATTCRKSELVMTKNEDK